jgi:omega-amidase
MQALNFTVVQTELFWEDIDANLLHLSDKLNDIEGTDLVILPEMFTTGFSMRPEMFARKSTEKGIAWMQHMAFQKNAAVMGSIMHEQDGAYYNALVFVAPGQDPLFYFKRHLFSPGEEPAHYTKGSERLLIQYKGWKICPLICYDLRFPVFSRNTDNYDVLVYVANWPEKRNYAWQQLLRARAIENQCYVIACNRLGEDGNGVNHIGNSGIINYMGEEISFGQDDKVFRFNLDKSSLLDYRKQFPVLEDRDAFTLK